MKTAVDELDAFALDQELEAFSAAAPPEAITEFGLTPDERGKLLWWVRFPEKLLAVLNMSPHDEELEALAKHFSEDCLFRTLALEVGELPDLVGRDKVVTFFSSVTRSMPDCIFVLIDSKVEHIYTDKFVLVFTNSFAGTEVDPADFKQSVFKANDMCVSAVSDDLSGGEGGGGGGGIPKSESREASDANLQTMHAVGKMVHAKARSYGRLFINRLTNQIERFECWWEILSLEPVKFEL